MKYNNKLLTYLLIPISLLITSCNDFLEENNQNGKYNDEIVWKTPKLAEGVLLKAYQMLPNDYTDKSDYGTGDMATNLLQDNTIQMATGAWSSRNSPLTIYNRAYEAITHINEFLLHVDQVDFAPQSDEKVKKMYVRKLKGEAYALRAWWNAILLKNHSGKDANGKLMGCPILDRVVNVSEAKVPRADFETYMKHIISDCDKALIDCELPLKWHDEYTDLDEKRVFGTSNINRINGLSVLALKSRITLLAASPAFENSTYNWQQAAEAAAHVMKENGGLDRLNAKALVFYNLGTQAADKTYLNSGDEVLWYTSIAAAASSREQRILPPSVYGNGEINPSQNLVDAFADNKGYPIDASTIYNAQKPYEKRDPRLNLYVYYHGSKLGSATINTATGTDAIGNRTTSTRTGYYLRKLMNEKTQLTPGNVIGAPHYYTHARYTEVLLNFAEAANESVGPDGDIEGFTARKVVNALRKRAGINDEVYVNSCDKLKLRELIRNERRIELCFEGFRFWDLRRWSETSSTALLNETVQGINWKTDNTYDPLDVEVRKYESYMIYAPIPYNETLKYDLGQNVGWE